MVTKHVRRFWKTPSRILFLSVAVLVAFLVGLLIQRGFAAWTDPTFAPPAGNLAPPVRIAPSAAQTDSSTGTSIWLNKTGASGDLLNLLVGGVSKFLVDRNGKVTLGAAPTAANDAATKAYVDAKLAGGEWIIEPICDFNGVLCTPPACPAGWTDRGTGCSNNAVRINPLGYCKRICEAPQPLKVIEPICDFNGVLCTPPACPAGWTDRGTGCSNNAVDTSRTLGYCKRICTQ